ncbi:MAG: ABC transporter substrate-binding protein [Proteobacteria bacterium]|nr:ABC transporter substrate-binding protein [Pseudomonadota bacterium]
MLRLIWRKPIHFLLCFSIIASLSVFTSPVVAKESVLTVGVENAPKTMDPRFAYDATGMQISHNLLFSTLVTLSADLRIIPRLAERWENPDDKTYVFYLRKGVRFHDGKPLTAEDVKFTFDHLKNKETKSLFAGTYNKSIDSIKVINPHKVEFKLKQVVASFTTSIIMPIIPKHVVTAGDDFPKKLIGSGPFKFVSQSPNQIVLEKNTDYYKGSPKVDKVVYKIIKDDNTRFLKMRKGELDLVINSMPLKKINDFRKKPLNNMYRVIENPGLSYQYLSFNVSAPEVQDVRIRQAIAHGIDVKEIVKYRLQGHAKQSFGVLSAQNWYTEEDVPKFTYDPETAKKILEEAGFKDPDGDGPQPRITLEMKTSTNKETIGIARIMKSQLAKIGIKLDVKSYEWGTFFGDIKNGNFQMTSLRWVGITEPDFYYDLFHSSMMPPNGRNRGRYNNPEIDKLAEQGRLELNPKKRKEIYSKIQKIIAKDLPYFSLWHRNNISLVHKRVSGYSQDPMGGYLSFYKISVK